MESITYTTTFLVTSLDEHLSSRFPGQQFLPEELDGLIQGLVNSLRWATLRLARQNLQKGQLFKLDSIATIDHFCTEQMSESEIVKRLENTSGLSAEICREGLRFVQQKIDIAIFSESAQSERELTREIPTKVYVEHIGVISGLEPSNASMDAKKRYNIELDKALSIKPKVRAKDPT